MREIISANGSTFTNGRAVFYRNRREPAETHHDGEPTVPRRAARLRECHHHPFEVWSQDDFYSFAAFFGRIGRKGVRHLGADQRRRE